MPRTRILATPFWWTATRLLGYKIVHCHVENMKAAPAYNDGPKGLERLDYVLAEACKRGIYIILTLVNNWPEFGGMDQYNTWYGNQYHHDFYTDSRAKEAYKAYVTHLVERVNTVNSISYKDDPTIFAWELANEPRCRGGRLGATDACGTDMLVDWATEMSAFIKQIDPNHMVAVGDEGFFDIEGNWDYPYSGAEGVDFERLLQIQDIDFGTFHMYPDHWGKDAQWGSQWIRDHAQMADTYDKPVVCEEFGWKNKQNRQDVFTEWIGVMDSVRLAGYNFWMLAAREDNGQCYPDYDGFTVYWGDPEADLFARNAAERATWSASAVRNAVPVCGSAPRSALRLVSFPPAERLRGLELSGCSLQGRHAKRQQTTAPLVLPLIHGEP